LIFRDNYKRIVDHNTIRDSGFELGINKFADLTEDEFLAGYTGLKVPEEVTRRVEMKGLKVPDLEEIQPVNSYERRRLKLMPPKPQHHHNRIVQSGKDQK